MDPREEELTCPHGPTIVFIPKVGGKYTPGELDYIERILNERPPCRRERCGMWARCQNMTKRCATCGTLIPSQNNYCGPCYEKGPPV